MLDCIAHCISIVFTKGTFGWSSFALDWRGIQVECVVRKTCVWHFWDMDYLYSCKPRLITNFGFCVGRVFKAMSDGPYSCADRFLYFPEKIVQFIEKNTLIFRWWLSESVISFEKDKRFGKELVVLLTFKQTKWVGKWCIVSGQACSAMEYNRGYCVVRFSKCQFYHLKILICNSTI